MPVIEDGKPRRFGESSFTVLLMLIKDAFNSFVKKELKTGSTSDYRTMTDNNLTDELKSKYDNAYTHSQTSHAPSNAQENVIELVKVNGTTLVVEGKAVDIPVPLLSTDLATDKSSTMKAASAKAVADYVASAVSGFSSISFKILEGTEYNHDTLVPTVAGESNYIYLVPFGSKANDSYKEYIWLNGTFECIGTTDVDLSGYVKQDDLVEFTADEIQSMWTNVFSS
ncbi:MAG: hypothetical protein NC215_00230 [Ruminococcus sp.]|nr:hypothetical protein [Ruminococcus sp.]